MSNDKKQREMQKFTENFRSAGDMAIDEVMVDFKQTSYYKRALGPFGQWKSGWSYMTDRTFIYPTGILGFGKTLKIPYANIKKLGKCTQFFMPLGFAITYEEPGTGKEVTEKFSIMKRDEIISFLEEKSGVTFS